MLTMTDINTIKSLRNNHDKSTNGIPPTLSINWRIAKKICGSTCMAQIHQKIERAKSI